MYRILPEMVSEESFGFADVNEDGFVTWLEHIKSTFGLDSDENIAANLEGDYNIRRRTFQVRMPISSANVQQKMTKNAK